MSEAKRQRRLLVVDDESHLLTGLELNLSMEGYQVACARTLAEARGQLDGTPVDLIMLDLTLPDGDGLEFCRDLRSRKDFTPVLMLTARGQTDDVVAGLEAGADDYITKPFRLTELLTRTHALLRRQDWSTGREPGRLPSGIGSATVDWDEHVFTRNGETRRLTGLEIRLLGYFIENAGRTLSREDLLRDVWGLSGYQTRTVDNFVARMRKYFEDTPSEPRHFLTVRGSGYRFEP